MWKITTGIAVLLSLVLAMVSATSNAASKVVSTRADGVPNVEAKANPEAARDAQARIEAITPGPVPADFIVSNGGLDWVWASPCIQGGCSNPDPANQAGWRFATAEELLSRPVCTAFLRQDQSLRCASEYFDPTYNHCDYGDCESGFIGSAPGQACVNGQVNGICESFYVRGELAPPVPVPAASRFAIILLTGSIALLGLFGYWRKHRA